MWLHFSTNKINTLDQQARHLNMITLCNLLVNILFSTSVNWRMPDILLGLIETEMGHESIISPDTLS